MLHSPATAIRSCPRFFFVVEFVLVAVTFWIEGGSTEISTGQWRLLNTAGGQIFAFDVQLGAAPLFRSVDSHCLIV